MICKIIILFSNLNTIFQKKIRKKMFIFFLWHPDEKSNSNYFSLPVALKKEIIHTQLICHSTICCFFAFWNWKICIIYKSRKILFKKHLSCHSFPSLEIYTIILHYIFLFQFFYHNHTIYYILCMLIYTIYAILEILFCQITMFIRVFFVRPNELLWFDEKVYLTIYLSICNRPPKPPVISPIIRPIPLWIIFESKIDNKKYLGISNIFLYLFGSKLTHSTSILLTKNT